MGTKNTQQGYCKWLLIKGESSFVFIQFLVLMFVNQSMDNTLFYVQSVVPSVIHYCNCQLLQMQYMIFYHGFRTPNVDDKLSNWVTKSLMCLLCFSYVTVVISTVINTRYNSKYNNN